MVATASVFDMLGKGIYTPKEAGYYSGVASQSVSRWMYKMRNSTPVITPTFEKSKRIVSFLDFIQIYIVHRARDKGVSLQKIRHAIQRKEKQGIKYPLARNDVVAMFGREIHTGDSEEEVEQFTGVYEGQRLLHKIAEPYLTRIDFNDHGYAERFVLYQQYGRNIWMDSRYEFGTPIVGTTGYPFYVLANAAKAEGSVPRAALAYAVSEEDIRVSESLRDKLNAA